MSFISEERLFNCTWYEFERIVYRLLQHSGWNQLSFTSKSHDHGADIIGTPPKGKNFVVLQCKHTGATSISKAGVDDVMRACEFYGTPLGVLVTNSKLSEPARRRVTELKNHYKIQVWNLARLAGFDRALPDMSRSRKTPRPYQQKAIDDVLDSFGEGLNRGLVTFATGLGKSIVLGEICREFIERHSPVLLLAERVQLIQQLESDLWSQLSKESSTRLWDGTRKPHGFDGVTVATQQSVLSAIRNGSSLPTFGVVLVDECHHAGSTTFRETLHGLRYEKLFGVTATPWRGDMSQVTEIFGPAVASMGIVEGIHRGFLADVDYTMYLDNLDWEQIYQNTESHLTIKDLNAKLFLPARDEDLCRQVVEEWNRNKRPPAITFCRSIDHALRLAELLTSMGMSSKAIHSRDMPQAERTRMLMAFKTRAFANLVAVDVLNEGIDVPDVEMIVFARVTHSRRIFVQQLGRGLRVTESKNRVRVLDFVADIRRAAEGIRLNLESTEFEKQKEIFRGQGAQIVNFDHSNSANFVEEYLADVADLDESDKIHLDFLVP